MGPHPSPVRRDRQKTRTQVLCFARCARSGRARWLAEGAPASLIGANLSALWHACLGCAR
jgi:hypothetical protein